MPPAIDLLAAFQTRPSNLSAAQEQHPSSWALRQRNGGSLEQHPSPVLEPSQQHGGRIPDEGPSVGGTRHSTSDCRNHEPRNQETRQGSSVHHRPSGRENLHPHQDSSTHNHRHHRDSMSESKIQGNVTTQQRGQDHKEGARPARRDQHQQENHIAWNCR